MPRAGFEPATSGDINRKFFFFFVLQLFFPQDKSRKDFLEMATHIG